jgi:flagellar export protein FliJ
MPNAFRFRLEKLLELRRLREDLALREFSEAQRAVQAAQRAVLGVLQEQDAARKAVQELKQGEVDLVRLRLQESYRTALERRLERERETLQERGRVEAEKRRALVEMRKGVRVLERFREKKLKAWRAEADLEERRFLDEVAQQAAVREGSAE